MIAGHVVIYRRDDGQLERALVSTAIRNALLMADRLVSDSDLVRPLPPAELFSVLQECKEIRQRDLQLTHKIKQGEL